MKNLFNDTLKTSAKWDLKKLTIFATMINITALGTFITISDKILDKVVNPYAIQVFMALLGFQILLMGLREVSKKFENKQESSKD